MSSLHLSSSLHKPTWTFWRKMWLCKTLHVTNARASGPNHNYKFASSEVNSKQQTDKKIFSQSKILVASKKSFWTKIKIWKMAEASEEGEKREALLHHQFKTDPINQVWTTFYCYLPMPNNANLCHCYICHIYYQSSVKTNPINNVETTFHYLCHLLQIPSLTMPY